LEAIERLNWKQAILEIEELASKSDVISPDTRTFISLLSNHLERTLPDSAAVPKRKPRSTASKPKRKGVTDVAETISQLSAKLKAAFSDDAEFENAVRSVEESGLKKSHVVDLYNQVLGTNKSFPKSATMEKLLDSLRKDRIRMIRAAS
jgi:hypothetical protein